MAGHKKQHFVPRSYLKAWCDPNTPAGQEPYVWRFNKDGSDPRRKAPDNLFHETDLYTIRRAAGQRDLVLEHGLAGLESEFVAIRDSTLSQGRETTPEDRLLLCAFMAAAHARTPTQRDHLGEQFGKIRKMMDDMIEWRRTATPEQVRAASTLLLGSSGASFDYDDVKRLAEKPMENLLFTQVKVATPHLAMLDFLVVEAVPEASFITSDNPCVWCDPEGYKRPPLYQTPALIYRSIEITLPVSPRLMILLNRRGRSGYFVAPERAVDELNRRTRAHCSEYFVSNSSTLKSIWLDPGGEPEDSWEKLHPRQARDEDFLT